MDSLIAVFVIALITTTITTMAIPWAFPFFFASLHSAGSFPNYFQL
jgi:hypothetical protein